MKYNMSAVEILKILGYNEPTGKEWLEKFKKDNNITLPKAYEDFMELAYNCPLFGTGNVWIGKHIGGIGIATPYFFFENIEEIIDDMSEDWEKNPAEAEEDIIYQISKLPKELWTEKTSDYLQIGSDYCSGIVTFGIKKDDLSKSNPPVYMQHEADEKTVWKKEYSTVSEFLFAEVLENLSCANYSTAEEALEEKGWEYIDHNEFGDEDIEEKLKDFGIDMDKLEETVCISLYDKRFLVYDEENNKFYVGCRNGEEEDSLYEIAYME